MKKILLVLFMLCGLLFLVSCEEKNNGQKPEPSVYNDVTEEQWNNNVKDFAFAKGEDTDLIITVYSSPEDGDDPDYIIYKKGLLFKFVTIVSETEFISYGDFKNNLGYRYYGIDRRNYFKYDLDETIDETIGSIFENFNIDFNKVKYENGEYISTIPYEGTEKYGHYKFINGRLQKFSIYFDNELDFKATIEPRTFDLVMPLVSRINEMPTSEMKIYLTEALKELKSYQAVGADYNVRAYDHYTIAEFEYLRTKNDDGSYKTIEQLLTEVKNHMVDRLFGNRVGIRGQEESLDELMWFGMFEDGNQDGLVIKLIPHGEKLYVVFGVVEYEVLNILVLKEYLENRFVVNPEEDIFWFDGTTMIDTKDCLLIQYESTMEGEYNTLVEYVKTCISDNGYEWAGSGSGDDYHYDILELDNKAVRVYFTSDEENVYNIKITFCISFGDQDPCAIIEYGVDSPLFDYLYDWD